MYLEKEIIRSEKHADFKKKKWADIQTIARHQYKVVEGYSIRGEAPKAFIKVQDSPLPNRRTLKNVNQLKRVIKAKRAKPNDRQLKGDESKWVLYIAKTGIKWYPIESITEHLIARIGAIVGLNMAYSRLAKIEGQIKFLSRYFIDHDSQELLHGTYILKNYLGESNDQGIVDEIQRKRQEREFFTLDTVVESIKFSFPNDYAQIIEDYFIMLLFDCWIGVQDRHFENWGVIISIYGNEKPKFSPIYDSARGLFWNEKEAKLQTWVNCKQIDAQISNLAAKSRPMVGLTTNPKANHFELADEILTDKYIPIKEKAKLIFSNTSLECVKKVIRKEFKSLLSKTRISLIIKCLENRHLMLSKKMC